MRLSSWLLAATITLSACFTGVVSAAADPICDHTELIVQIPQPNPYDKVPAGELPEPSGVGFTVSVSKVNGLAVYDYDPHMDLELARSRGLAAPHTKVTNAAAQAVFTGLSEGIYLLEVDAPNDPAYRKAYVDDMLISVPVGGLCQGTVTAKIHYEPHPQTPPLTTPPTPGSRTYLGWTGARVTGLAAVAIILISSGLVIGRKARREEHS